MTNDDQLKDEDIEMQPNDDLQEDLSADDELFDEEQYAEGEASEDWEAYDAELGNDEGIVLEKKKLPLFNIVLIGGAVVFGLLFITLKLSGGSQQPAAESTPAPVETASTTPPDLQPSTEPGKNQQDDRLIRGLNPQVTDPSVGAEAKGGLLNDTKQLNNLPNTIATEASPSAVQHGSDTDSDESANPAKTNAKPPMPSSISSLPAPSGGDALTPMPASAMKAQTPPPAPVAATVPVAETQPAVAQASAPAADTAAMDGLNQKLDQLLSRIAALETKTNAPQAAPDEGDIQALQATLKQMDGRLRALENQPAKPSATSMPPVSNEVTTTPVEGTPRAAVRRVAPKHIRAATDEAYHASATSMPAAAPASKTGIKWVLKSAQPDQAYVSRPDHDDMFSIRPGDTLPGIGRVTAITSINGQWSIIGTEGTIGQ